MKNIKAFALAGLIGMIALAGGSANQAAAQSDDVVVDGRIITGENYKSAASMPTDQNQGFVQQAYGDALGRKAGDGENGALIGLLRPAERGGITDGTMPTDQRGGYVQGVYGDLLGRDTGDGQSAGAGKKAWTGNLTLGSTATLGSLNGVGSTRDLFANSRGGDQGNGLLLPAVRAANGIPGASVPEPPERGTGNPADIKGLNFTNAAGGGSQPDAASAGRTGTFTLTFNGQTTAPAAGAGGGGPQLPPGTLKGLNFSTTARK